MLKVSCKLVSVSILVSSLLGCASPQSGSKDKYAVIALYNKTQYRVDYSYRWGQSGDWHNNYIKPGATYRHWWTFSYPGENYAPWFYLDNNEQQGILKLRSFYSPDTSSEHSREYKFDWDEDHKKIILYHKRYK